MRTRADLKIWVFALVVGLGAILLNFNSIVPKIEAFFPQINHLVESDLYNSFNNLRGTEEDFWDNVKGIDTKKNSDETPVPTANIANTTPNPITTVVPTLSDYNPTNKISAPFKVQIIGDSMILEGFGPQMKIKLLEYDGVSVKDNGRYSTGLNRVDYFDWFKESENLIRVNQPDVLIVMFGANDGQNIVAKDKSIGNLGTDKWKTIYRERVSDYLKLVSDKVGLIYWVGHPIPRTTDFYNKFSVMNPIYEEECAKFTNCRYVDEWARFAVDGKYSPTLADDNGLVQNVKGSDGVHVTVHGGKIMADEVIRVMKMDITMEKE